jgi:hypothetical protein
MHMLLCIESETEKDVELSVTSEGERVGSMLADQQAIRYGVKLAKGAVPLDMVKRIEVIEDTQGIYRVEIYTKGDEKWNENVKRRNPVLFFLGLIKKSSDGHLTLGSFENREQAERFKRFLSIAGYPVELNAF